MTSRDDRGETLLELIVAVSIMAVVGVAFVSILASVALNANVQAQRATAHTVLSSAGQRVQSAPWVDCAAPLSYQAAAGTDVPSGLTVTVVSVAAWTATGFDTAPQSAPCPRAQRVDLRVTSSDGRVAESLSVGKSAT